MSEATPNNKDNREKLSRDCVSVWSSDDLVEYAILKLDEEYEGNEEFFQEDWKDIYGIDETGTKIFFKKSP
jgi:hypothetical protein|tara:strand:+ start:5345 stop:5557 length:213 start_codon:yes stop_codon:yes gene_type:complete